MKQTQGLQVLLTPFTLAIRRHLPRLSSLPLLTDTSSNLLLGYFPGASIDSGRIYLSISQHNSVSGNVATYALPTVCIFEEVRIAGLTLKCALIYSSGPFLKIVGDQTKDVTIFSREIQVPR